MDAKVILKLFTQASWHHGGKLSSSSSRHSDQGEIHDYETLDNKSDLGTQRLSDDRLQMMC